MEELIKELKQHIISALNLEDMSPDDIDADAIDNRLFGTLFHTAAEMLYNDIKTGDNTLHADAIRRFIKTPALLERYVDKAFRQELFRIDDSRRTCAFCTFSFPVSCNGRKIQNHRKGRN